jgi:drug/metabolite transporter (DMT)-like permease
VSQTAVALRTGHLRALIGMVVVTLLWSTAGLATRHLESARSFEVTFWRSAFTALSLTLYLVLSHRSDVIGVVMRGGKALWLSGALWAVMFTCFMLALTMTTVANVLITMSLGPLATALLARFILGQPVPRRTWAAIVVAGVGLAWMYGHGLSADPKALLGTLVALAVPLAAAINWNTMQRQGARVDLVPALLVGAVLSSLVTLPMSWPFAASVHDVAILGALGVFQLAIPCVIAVRLARELPAPEMALLCLLEVVFGIAWAWWGANEQPDTSVLTGGAVVLGSLVFNEWWGLRQSARRPGAPTSALPMPKKGIG